MKQNKSKAWQIWCANNKEKRREYQKKYYKNKPKKWKKERQKMQNKYRTERYYPKNRYEALLNYSPKRSRKPKCCCCGETMYECLSIDHIKPRNGKHKKRNFGSANLYQWLKSHGYPKGFQTYCMNCNFAKGRKKSCPHHN